MPKGSPLILILGLFFASFGYGINLVSFSSCVMTLVVADGRLKSRPEINSLLTASAAVMILLATADVVVTLCQSVALFVDKNLLADQQFGGIRWWSLAVFGFFVAQVAVGDTILIYRCFVLWNRTWSVIVASILLSLAAAGKHPTFPFSGSRFLTPHTGCGLSVIILGSAKFVLQHLPSINPLLTSLMVMALASNVLTSFLIIVRLSAIQKESTRYNMTCPNDRIGRVVRISIDAGLAYTASLFVLLGFHLRNGQAQDVVMHAIVQIIGISFNLVICRIVRDDPDEEILSSIMTLPPRPAIIKKRVVKFHTRPKDDWSSRSPSQSTGKEVNLDNNVHSLHPSQSIQSD